MDTWGEVQYLEWFWSRVHDVCVDIETTWHWCLNYKVKIIYNFCEDTKSRILHPKCDFGYASDTLCFLFVYFVL